MGFTIDIGMEQIIEKKKQLIKKMTILANTKGMAGDEIGYYQTMDTVKELEKELEVLLK